MTEGLADSVRQGTERVVEEEVDVALRRMDGVDEYEREVIEEVAENVAQRLMQPVFDSLEDGNVDGRRVGAKLFEEMLSED